MRKLRVLDLFSGIGGFSLGLERTGGFRTVAFCEIEAFPRAVLAKHWPEVPCFPDIRTLRGSDIGAVDVVCGGYPCQPFSTAGKRGGAQDDRHLWPHLARLVAELRPAWVVGENVAGHVGLGLDDVLSDLEGQGYTCRAFVVPACAVDAPHRRDRVWIIGHADRDGEPDGPVDAQVAELPVDVADADGQRRDGSAALRGTDGQRIPEGGDCGPPRWGPSEPGMGGMVDGLSGGLVGDRVWEREPDVPRVAHDVKDRTNRLRALGNAVVPQIPEMIGHAILKAEAEARGALA